MKRFISRGLLGCLAVLLAAAVANAEVSGPPRIVSLSPGLTEIFFAIGAQDRLAGVSRQCDYPLAARLKPKCGDFNHPDMAGIIGADAELVLFSEQVREAELAALADAGMQARIFPARSADEVIQSIFAIGDRQG